MYILLRIWCILLHTVQQRFLIEISLAEEQAGSKFNHLADEKIRPRDLLKETHDRPLSIICFREHK